MKQADTPSEGDEPQKIPASQATPTLQETSAPQATPEIMQSASGNETPVTGDTGN